MLRSGFWAAVGVALAIGCAAGGMRLAAWVRASVRDQARYQMPLAAIELTPPPIWFRGDLLREVQYLAGLPDTLHTLEPRLAESLREAFALHPWVREVAEVRVIHPARIRVRLAYREPVALVRTIRALEPVDRDAVVLPREGLASPELYLTITGVRSTPTGPAGTRWEDPGVVAGSATAEVLAAHRRTLGLSNVDVSRYRPTPGGSAAIWLETDQGTRIRWGRPPGVDHPGEVSTEDKIERLLRYVAEHGTLDKPPGREATAGARHEIDLTHWQEIITQPR